MNPEISRALEAILLVADVPLDNELLGSLVELTPQEVEQHLVELAAEYVESGRGIQVVRVAGGWRYQTNPALAPYVERFVLEGQTAKLSAATLETLAIIAYKQPVTRAKLEAIIGAGLRDAHRELHPDEQVFTWWDYRAGMFHQDLGMRIDLVLAGDVVAKRVKAAWIDRRARKGKGPSDHAPVIVDLDEAPDGDIGPVVPPPSAPVTKRGAKKLPQSLPD